MNYSSCEKLLQINHLNKKYFYQEFLSDKFPFLFSFYFVYIFETNPRPMPKQGLHLPKPKTSAPNQEEICTGNRPVQEINFFPQQPGSQDQSAKQ